jgi:hypothetical protein
MVSFSSPGVARLLCGTFDIRHVFSFDVSNRREPCRHDGSIWSKDG